MQRCLLEDGSIQVFDEMLKSFKNPKGVIPLHYLGMGIKLDPIDSNIYHFYKWKVNLFE